MSKCTKPASTTTATKTIFNRTGVPFSVRRRERRQASWKGAATNFLWNTLAIAPRKAPVSPSLAVGSERRVFSSPLPFLSHSLSLSLSLSLPSACSQLFPLFHCYCCVRVFMCVHALLFTLTHRPADGERTRSSPSLFPQLCVCALVPSSSFQHGKRVWPMRFRSLCCWW